MAPLIVFISGTDTEIGKTWTAAKLIESLRASDPGVCARKPVQSFDRHDPLTDAQVLAAATGETPEQVTPEHRTYPLPMAPPMAAEALERPDVELHELIAETELPRDGIVIVEGVGGPRSPVAHDGDSVSLAWALNADLVVIVASAGLGVVNSVMLSTNAFAPLHTLVFLNRFDPVNDLHARNRRWLAERHELRVATTVQEISAVVSHMRAERASTVG